MRKKNEERLILNLNSREIKQLAIAYVNSAPLKKILPLAELMAKSKMGLLKERAKKEVSGEPDGEAGETKDQGDQGEQGEPVKRHRWTKEEEKMVEEKYTPITKGMQYKKEADIANKDLAAQMKISLVAIRAKYNQLRKGA